MRFNLVVILILISSISAFPYSKYELYCNYDLLQLSGEIAISQNGTLENGRNIGDIYKYLKIFSAAPGTPYCAAGIYWTFFVASQRLSLPQDSIPIPKTMVANDIYRFARINGIKKPYKANINDLIVWRRKSSYRGHIERVIKVGEKGNITTIAFNTNSIINGRKVEGVFIKKRNIYHPLSNLAIRGLIGFRTNNA